MAYSPTSKNAAIIERASHWVQSVPYRVTARWVFYRLLQEGVYGQKAGYKHLLALLSKARKEFYDGWKPDTLADGTRAALVRGDGFDSPQDWLDAVRRDSSCFLDHWAGQSTYVECWFEAAAMEGQFLHYADPNITLLAFHGDVSIPEKWKAASRLAERFIHLQKPITIYYFGDYDPKGITIPLSAWSDISAWAVALVARHDRALLTPARHNIRLHRVGLNYGDEVAFNIPENPERPGTYQWEALADEQARGLIQRANDDIDFGALQDTLSDERKATRKFIQHLEELEL